MDNQTDLTELKSKVDIVELIGSYITLKKTGANYSACCPFHGELTPSFSVSPAKEIFHCFGCGVGGDSIKFIELFDKIDTGHAIGRLKDFINEPNTYVIHNQKSRPPKPEPIEKETKTIDLNKLAYFGKKQLQDGQKIMNYIVTFENEGVDKLHIDERYAKLFEAKSGLMSAKYEQKINFLFGRILGYDSFYNAPSIILMDRDNTIVDYIIYRPTKPANYNNWSNPKYIVKNSEGRGDNFIYPFEKYVSKLIEREKYFLVGEGIKNAVNALIYGIPFISVESTSNISNPKLIAEIKRLIACGYAFETAFDGDGWDEKAENWTKGKLAFETFKKETGLKANNILDFKSGIDFTEHMVSEND